MRRLLLIPIALLGLMTAGAAASTHRTTTNSAVGKIKSLSSTSIKVGKEHGLWCRFTSHSPDISAFNRGERVRIDCISHILVAIAGMGNIRKTTLTDGPQTTAGISGAVTALGSSSITVHDGDRNLTCTLGESSPGVGSYKLGDHVKIGCLNGVLVLIGKNDGPPTTTSNDMTGIAGAISVLGLTSITVHDGDRNLPCTIGSSSPSVTGFKLGDAVRMYCQNGALYSILHTDTPPATTTTTSDNHYTYQAGTISALVANSISVHGEHDLTCTIGATSPSVTGFQIGNGVRMYCANGTLYALLHT